MKEPVQPRQNILYEEPSETYKEYRSKQMDAFMIFLGVGVVFLLTFLIGFYFAPLMIVNGIILFTFFCSLGYSQLRNQKSTFRIYENGIQPFWTKMAFIQFSDIDHIVIFNQVADIVMRDGRSARLHDMANMVGGNRSNNYDTILQLVVEHTKKAHPNENEYRLIRNLTAVKWSEEAQKEYNSHFRPTIRDTITDGEDDFRSRINQAVLADGRNTVESADVQRFLK
jgi:histone H3/H4